MRKIEEDQGKKHETSSGSKDRGAYWCSRAGSDDHGGRESGRVDRFTRDTPKPVPVTKIIDRTSEKLPVDATTMNSLRSRELTTAENPQGAVVTKPVPLPAGVAMHPGETIQVNYSDGIAVHQMISLACTSTSTVDTPYVSSGYAWSYHTHGLSSGCSGSTSVNGILSSYAAPWWWQRDFETVTVTSGSTLYWPTNKKCASSGSTTWHSENAIGSSDTALSPDRNLACNPG